MRLLITGAASGIGLATAQLLADEQLQVAIVGRNSDRLDAAAEDLRNRGARVLPIAGDVASPEACQQVVDQAAAEFGGLDVLISNAGVMNNNSLLDLDFEQWDHVYNVNVRATWLLARAAHPHLKKTQGSIVVTGSISAHHPIPAQGAYSSSKAAVLMLVRQLANDWAPDGIRVNSVSPGMVVTDMSAQFYADEERRKKRAATIPLREVADPERIASVIAFAASPAAAYMTGQDILVDGGVDTALMPAIRAITDA